MNSRPCDILCEWYQQCGRDLPWRATRNPYFIWLSEIILQQTRVEQGRRYYEAFVRRFPRVEDLAAAQDDEVMLMWQGLGYYSRARNLHTAAKQVVEVFRGEFPKSYEELRQLKGVGEYTAAAVAAFAYDESCAVVDGNVYRVLSRLYDVEEAIDSTRGKRLFQELAREVMADARPSIYNQAIMDFGAMVCTPQNPHCEECPLADRCVARQRSTIGERPQKQGRVKTRHRWFTYLYIESGSAILMRKRPEGDIWTGLYELPMIETPCEVSFEQLSAMEEFRGWMPEKWTLCDEQTLPLHRLTHQVLHAKVIRFRVEEFRAEHHWLITPVWEVGEKAVPRLLERYFEQIKNG